MALQERGTASMWGLRWTNSLVCSQARGQIIMAGVQRVQEGVEQRTLYAVVGSLDFIPYVQWEGNVT